MTIDPIVVSVSALGVSIVSLLITAYRGGVEHRLQWEQMRGRAHTRLTSRAIELLTIVEDLRQVDSVQANAVIQRLVAVMQGLVEMRTSLKGMKSLGWFWPSLLSTKLEPIVSELDDADVIFDALGVAVQKRDLIEARTIADGLIERIYGSKGKPNAAPNSRPPSQLPASPEVQSSDSQRIPSSSGGG